LGVFTTSRLVRPEHTLRCLVPHEPAAAGAPRARDRTRIPRRNALHAYPDDDVHIKGLRRWCDRFLWSVRYGIKVSFRGSGTLRIVFPSTPPYPEPYFRMADYTPFG